MSTISAPLKYLWQAYFEDGTIITQPANDQYSKHDEKAEHNPSAFRDIQDYEKTSPLISFVLNVVGDEDGSQGFGVNLKYGVFIAHTGMFSLEDDVLSNRKLIFFRQINRDFQMGEEIGDGRVRRYGIGYEGKNAKGRVIKKVIHIDG